MEIKYVPLCLYASPQESISKGWLLLVECLVLSVHIIIIWGSSSCKLTLISSNFVNINAKRSII